MSRDLEDSDYYITHGGIIPVKWTAPEVIILDDNLRSEVIILFVFPGSPL